MSYITCSVCGNEFTRHIKEDTKEQVMASAYKFGWVSYKDQVYCARCVEEWTLR